VKVNVLQKFLSVDNMVKPEYLCGELIETRAAYRNLLRIAIPSIIEMVFVSLIGSVDVIMVGRLGYESIAAVGLATQPHMLMLSMFLALNIGVTAIVARRKGQDLPREASRTLRNALILVMGFTAVVMTLAIIFSRNILLFAGAQSDTVDMSADYFRIIAYFLPASTLNMCINAAQRGVGNTRISMISNVDANIVNVFFNYLLIYGNWGFPRLGVAGAAWASGIGYCVGLGISVFALIRSRRDSNFLRVSFKDDWRLHKETVKSIFKVGGNSVLEQIAQRLGIFVCTVIIANLGTAIFAAHQVGMQLIGISFNFATGLSAASISLVGQMLGKNRPDLAIVYGKCSQRLALLISLCLAASIAVLRVPLVSIYLNRSDPANAISFDLAVNLMLMVALFQPPQTSSVVLSGCLRGAGDNLYVALVMCICVAVIRPLLSITAVYVFGFGLMGAWGASFSDICIRLSLVYYRFAGSKWHNKTV